MDSRARFWNRMADGYAKSPVGDEAAYQKKLETTRGYLRPDMQILEFGCGTGTTAIHHAPAVSHIHAIDISTRMLEIAEEKAKAQGIENITWNPGTLEDVDVPEASVDAVLGMSILHLVEDWRATIAQVHRLLKPGGVFVSSTICLSDKFWFLRPVLPIGRVLGLIPRLSFFTSATLEAEMKNAGFEVDHRWQPGGRSALFLVAKRKA